MKHNNDPFILDENELAVLYDMLYVRIQLAEHDGITASSEFRQTLLDKLTRAIIWRRSGVVVTVCREEHLLPVQKDGIEDVWFKHEEDRYP